MNFDVRGLECETQSYLFTYVLHVLALRSSFVVSAWSSTVPNPSVTQRDAMQRVPDLVLVRSWSWHFLFSVRRSYYSCCY